MPNKYLLNAFLVEGIIKGDFAGTPKNWAGFKPNDATTDDENRTGSVTF
jgi:hypothetical protein